MSTAPANSTSELSRLAATARSLVQRMLTSYHPDYGFSTTSVQVYDTAWVSMISKTTQGRQEWLFPASFHYLLKTQSEDGSWGAHPDTQTVGILDTASALLALIRHYHQPLQICDVSPSELKRRIKKATESLRHQLDNWDDVQESNHIGVEIIVPALLEYLSLEDPELYFVFEARTTLLHIRDTKLASFKPEYLYGQKPLSLLHSLEAFIGKIDFDKVSHHVFQGSMMASPSSTAAYLMNVSCWDDVAEAYLRHVSSVGSGHGDGGIPGTFPTANFEFNWTITTLLRAGVTNQDLDCPELHTVTEILIKAFQDEKGVIGFAPRAVDADDTAKGLLTLSLLGRSETVSPKPMIRRFEVDNHFSTFGSERDASFTTNCHVLMALLHQDEAGKYTSQICKTVKFLCDWWWTHDGKLKDKWNLSHMYPTMLMVEAFTDLLSLLDTGSFPHLLTMEQQLRMAIALFQACNRTLKTQDQDGSWDGKPEHTAYAILVLAEARRICLFSELQDPIFSAIQRGVLFLKSVGHQSFDYNWTSKTAYRTSFVAEAYLIAAQWVGCSNRDTTQPQIGKSLSLDDLRRGIKKHATLLYQTPMFSSVPEWKIQASMAESMLFIPLLQQERLSIFSRDKFQLENDSYINMIPFTWVGPNNRSGAFVSTSFIYDMMLLSMYGYQVDEFIETVAAPAFGTDTQRLHSLIDDTIGQIAYKPNNPDNRRDSLDPTVLHTQHNTNNTDPNITLQLTRFITYVLHHPTILRASPSDRTHLRHELSSFLHAHTTQLTLNHSHTNTSPPFFTWLRTTAADHVACAYSHAFAACLQSATLTHGTPLYPSITQSYLVQHAVRHLATACRIYNDYGSAARDAAEHNLNAMDFPEFDACAGAAERRAALEFLGRHEWGCLEYVLGELRSEIGRAARGDVGEVRRAERKMGYLGLFCDVTALYNQIYARCDVSARVRG
ncbi:Ent-kaur-16-ene synthase [Pseudovirgaria hyperparasitica]|uniref:Ent-kaur-16-ene synthase n=1 Tax=Pseudovirgaria hyperparasitica TaxID=470096 RepID=A0A6A6W0V7_9PEZI|nr:Ent-kaur-16-ene synthase [Pseudovirgaria hyperparasitica]KAF2756145.1 Ent-kaur-16-ene synthase [Pseudovirgaria hyperparasitica]